jgi:hypothetical protein
MRTTWYVLVKQINGTVYFRSREDSPTEGAFTIHEDQAETFPMSDSLRDEAMESGSLPVPADFFGIEV